MTGVGVGRIGNGWEDERGKYWGEIDVGGEELPSRHLEWGWALGKRRGLFVVRVGTGVVALWVGDGDGFSLGKSGTLSTGWTSFALPEFVERKYVALYHCLPDGRLPREDHVLC